MTHIVLGTSPCIQFGQALSGELERHVVFVFQRSSSMVRCGAFDHGNGASVGIAAQQGQPDGLMVDQLLCVEFGFHGKGLGRLIVFLRFGSFGCVDCLGQRKKIK